jgi:sulfur-carrier protein
VVVRIVYFAWVREKIGIDGEDFSLPHSIKSGAQLAAVLAMRGGGYAEAFGDISKLRCAVNQQMLALDAPFDAPVEIAFFPPVTGG